MFRNALARGEAEGPPGLKVNTAGATGIVVCDLKVLGLSDPFELASKGEHIDSPLKVRNQQRHVQR